ncbi:MAG: protein TonB [Cyclobacteriaceae bacterium]|jgi:protein TonB
MNRLIISFLLFPFFTIAQETLTPKTSNESILETPPEFPGGIVAFYNYVSEELKYPKAARKADIEGRVNVQFRINKTGEIVPDSTKVVGSPSVLLNEEAIRIINNCPKWIPVNQNGRPVDSQLTIPIIFRLP